MTDSLDVDPATLVQAAEGITSIIGSLGELGIIETGAAGRGFELLALSPMEAGHAELQKALEEFATRWAWGVRHLVRAGNEIAELLELSAGRYHLKDQQGETTLKTVWTTVLGNPRLGENEIAQRDWSETLADNPVNHIRNPDYSVQSFEESFEVFGGNLGIIAEAGPQAVENISSVAGVATGGPGWIASAGEHAVSRFSGDAEGTR